MKKHMAIAGIITGVIVTLAVPALAMDDPVIATQPAAAVDWSAILGQTVLWLIGVAGTIISSVVAYAGKKYVIPWLREKRLSELAKSLVAAAEAELGRHTGILKWDQVAVWLSMRGLSVEAAEVRQAVEQAWLTLNHEMIALGLKEAPVENPDPFASPERPASMG